MIRRIIWGTLFLITFLTFYFWMPAHVYLSHPLLSAIFGGIFSFLFLMQTFADFRSPDEITAWDEYPKEWYHNMSFVCFPAAIALTVMFSNHYSKLEEDELKQFAEIVPGIIVDGYSQTRIRKNSSSGSTSYNLTVSYYTKTGSHLRTQETVNSYEYSLASKGQHIQVAYSSKHPRLSKILLGDEMIEKFTGITSRDLTIGDMVELLDMPRDSILPTLNRISYRWKLIGGKNPYYENEFKKISVGVTQHERVTYGTLDGNRIYIMGFVKNAGFKQERTDTADGKNGDEMILYTKGDLSVMEETKTVAYEKYKNTDERFAFITEALNKKAAQIVTVFRRKKI